MDKLNFEAVEQCSMIKVDIKELELYEIEHVFGAAWITGQGFHPYIMRGCYGVYLKWPECKK